MYNVQTYIAQKAAPGKAANKSANSARLGTWLARHAQMPKALKKTKTAMRNALRRSPRPETILRQARNPDTASTPTKNPYWIGTSRWAPLADSAVAPRHN